MSLNKSIPDLAAEYLNERNETISTKGHLFMSGKEARHAMGNAIEAVDESVRNALMHATAAQRSLNELGIIALKGQDENE